MASTKCAWKRGSIAVSIFSTRRTRSSMAVRAVASSSAIRAPAPAALPTEATLPRSQSGIMPSTIACFVSMWLPKAPASPMRSTSVDAEVVHQQRDARVQRRLRELDRAHVVLRDLHRHVAAVQHVGEGPAVGDDAVAARGERAVDHAVLRDDAREVHLGDDLDDAGAADAGDAGARRRRGEARHRPTTGRCRSPCSAARASQDRCARARWRPAPRAGRS